MSNRCRRRPAGLLLGALTFFQLGCVGLRPFEDVATEVAVERFVEVGGQRVHVAVEGDGEPLVLVHGFGGSTYSWRLVQPRLAERFRTVALDLNGFGFTERPADLAGYSRSGQLRLIRGVMDALGVRSAHFLAHSYGGGLTLTLAHQSPERVRSMVLVGSTDPAYVAERRRGIAALPLTSALFVRALALRPAFVRRALKRSYYDDTGVDDDLVTVYAERLRIEGASRAYRGLSRPHRSAEDLAPAPLEEIAQPTLVVWGKEDDVVPLEIGATKTELLPRGRFAVLDDCGHMPMEERPEAFLGLVEPFLAEVSGDPEQAEPQITTTSSPAGSS